MADEQPLDHLRKSVNKLENANRETMQQLQRRGNAPQAIMMTQLRLEILVSMMLGNMDSERRLQFELVWQRELQELLSEMYQAQSKKLHIPGR